MGGQEHGDESKEERSEDAVAESDLLLLTRQSEHQDRQHQRVVGAEDPLEDNQQPDRDQIGCFEIERHRATSV